MDGRRTSALVFAPAARDDPTGRRVSPSFPFSCASALYDGRIGSMGEVNVLHDTLERRDVQAAS
ncbi:MAG: hypothetical protein ACRDH7_07860 [Actinomycetota bacterium]